MGKLENMHKKKINVRKNYTKGKLSCNAMVTPGGQIYNGNIRKRGDEDS